MLILFVLYCKIALFYISPEPDETVSVEAVDDESRAVLSTKKVIGIFLPEVVYFMVKLSN